MDKLAITLAVLLVLAGCTTGPPPSRTDDDARGVAVTVVEVYDGDTMKVRYANGTTTTIRLIGVDTPETDRERVAPSEYEGINNRTHLYRWGQRAKREAGARLANERVRIVATGYGVYDRLLVYVYVDGQNFNLWLVESGHARFYESQFEQRAPFKRAEEQARHNDTGLWQ